MSGQLTLNGAPANGEVIVMGASGEVTFGLANNGVYELHLPAGNFTVVAELDGDHPGAVPPPTLPLTVPGGGPIQQVNHSFNFTMPPP